MDNSLANNDLAMNYETFAGSSSSDGTEAHDYNDILETVGCGQFQLCIAISLILSSISGALMFVYLQVIPIILQCDNKWNVYTPGHFMCVGLFGIVIGANILGIIADVYGRKISMIVSNVSLTCLTVAGAIVPNAKIFATIFFFIGMFSSGCMLQPIVYSVEIVPKQFRSLAIFGLLGCGILGSLISLSIAIPFYSKNWQIWIGLNAIVPLVTALCTLCLPESPLFNISRKETAKEGLATLQMYARFNRKSLPEGQLLSQEAEHRGNPKSAFTLGNRKVTFLLLVSFIVYGCVCFGSGLIETSLQKKLGNSNNGTFSDPSACKSYNNGLLIEKRNSQAIDLCAILIGICLVGMIGRKWTVGLLGICDGILLFVYIASMNLVALTAVTTCIRLCNITIVFTLLIYCVEIFKCEIRAIMTGLNFSLYIIISAIGYLISSFAFKATIMPVLIVLGLLAIGGAFVVVFLPMDTRNKTVNN